VLSGLGYLGNGFAVFLFPDLADVMATVVIVAALIGELPLTLWLLIKGINADRWHERAVSASVQPVAAGAI